MMTKQQTEFIKTNRKILEEIYSDKLADLTKQLFDAKVEDRGKMIDAINVLRDWLREVYVLGKLDNNKPDNFI